LESPKEKPLYRQGIIKYRFAEPLEQRRRRPGAKGNSEAVAAGCKKDQTPARPI